MMKKNLSRLFWSMSVAFCMIAIFAFTVPQDQKAGAPWKIPATFKASANTFKGAASEKVGKLLYAKHCKSCHGNIGEGDGPKASSMKTKIESFKDPKFQAQADKDIYYQIVVGRDEMPAFDKKLLDEEDRWALVNYVRTLK